MVPFFVITGATYRFILLKTDVSEDTLNVNNAAHLGQEIENLQAENEALKQRIEALEIAMGQGWS